MENNVYICDNKTKQKHYATRNNNQALHNSKQRS